MPKRRCSCWRRIRLSSLDGSDDTCFCSVISYHNDGQFLVPSFSSELLSGSGRHQACRRGRCCLPAHWRFRLAGEASSRGAGMRSTVQLENIEEMRRQEGIEDTELWKAIQALR